MHSQQLLLSWGFSDELRKQMHTGTYWKKLFYCFKKSSKVEKFQEGMEYINLHSQNCVQFSWGAFKTLKMSPAVTLFSSLMKNTECFPESLTHGVLLCIATLGFIYNYLTGFVALSSTLPEDNGSQVIEFKETQVSADFPSIANTHMQEQAALGSSYLDKS